MDNVIRVVVSGSFHRALDEVQRAVREAVDRGARVLSPVDPTVVDSFGDFLYVASDRLRAIRAVQGRHFLAIESADVVWLACPDGYVGLSAAAEIGYAVRCGTPVFTDTPPTDLTMRLHVSVVGNLGEALGAVRDGRDAEAPSILLDPAQGVGEAHRHLDAVERALLTPSTAVLTNPAAAPTDEVFRLLRGIR